MAHRSRITTADAIKVAAVATAIPRWVGALLAAEGFAIPVAWLGGWVIFSAICGAGMAIVEGLAFAYVFNAWRNESGRRANVLFVFAVLSGIVFTLVGAPYIAAQVRELRVADVLQNDAAWWLWSASVFASTILILISVGYAQRSDASATEPPQNATDALLSVYRAAPTATQGQAAAQIGKSRSWVGKRLGVLEAEERISRDDGMVKVLE